MRISHGDAITLEMIVRHVHDCDRAGMGGYIDADHYEFLSREQQLSTTERCYLY